MAEALQAFKNSSGLEKQHFKEEINFLSSEVKRLEEEKKFCEAEIKKDLRWHKEGMDRLKRRNPESKFLQ